MFDNILGGKQGIDGFFDKMPRWSYDRGKQLIGSIIQGLDLTGNRSTTGMQNFARIEARRQDLVDRIQELKKEIATEEHWRKQ